MRTPATTARVALYDRLKAPDQASTDVLTERELPPYLESFLAHLRLLVGVPMEYLIPDDRLLPPESIRFFYLDRSWTDRLVDGAIAVGKIGSREQAHYQAHAANVSQTLDLSERMVRALQRGQDFDTARKAPFAAPRPADVVTGFILRSSAVKNWPHMDVRAYDKVLDAGFKPADADPRKHQLKTLRLERIAPAVLIALFEGEPQFVICEEPHHGVQFGLQPHRRGPLTVSLREPTGVEVNVGTPHVPVSVPVSVPVRPGHHDVVRIAALQQALHDQEAAHPSAIKQEGSAAFAISVLDPPFRQRFQGTVDLAESGDGRVTDPPRYVAVSGVVREAALNARITTILGGH